MPVTFEMRVPPGEKAPGYPNDVPVEYVAIPLGVDVVSRRATELHRERYASEYAAFLASLNLTPPAVAPLEVQPVAVEVVPEAEAKAPEPEAKKPGLFSRRK